jgi:heat shock protein HslJ
MEFEQDYIDRLQKVASWRIQRHSLRLMDSSGLTLLRFRRIGTPAGSNI